MPDTTLHRYRVKLQPVTTYFFGDERGFGTGDKQNYLVKSRSWPQQTTLLGMLRYLLLREKNLLAEAGQPVSAAGESLIGQQSFHLDPARPNFGERLNFGAIDSLGPVYLLNGNSAWFPAPLYHGKTTVPQSTAHAWLGQGKQQAVLLDGYNPKTYESPRLISAAGDIREQSEVFQEVTQTGIEKGRNGQPKTEAFYKQTSVTFTKESGHDWYFAFTVQTREPLPAKGLVPMGGEQRVFAFEATKETEDPGRYPLPAGMQPAIVLLSDALADPAIYAGCEFATIRTLDFRFLQTSISQTTRYHNLSRDGRKTDLVKSGKFTLLEKGSVLYPRDPARVKALLDLPRLQQIGYNH